MEPPITMSSAKGSVESGGVADAVQAPRRVELTEGVAWSRVGAAALSLGLTSGLMVWARRPHPPAGATTLIVSLWILRRPADIVILMVAVAMIVVQGYVINRTASIPYLRWSPVPSEASPKGSP